MVPSYDSSWKEGVSVLLGVAVRCYAPSVAVPDVVFISLRKTSIIFCPHPSGKLIFILMYVIFCACAHICDCMCVCVACFCITLFSTLERCTVLLLHVILNE